MTDRPIIFSAPMIQALLAGRKTQTRRLVRFPQWAAGCFTDPLKIETADDHGHHPEVICEDTGCLSRLPLRYAIGDRLWVREAWRPGYDAEGFREDLGRVARPSDFDPASTAIEYLADGTRELAGKDRPSIHMPRWASRLTLVVTDVRVQRLQEISEDDAIAEGVVAFVESLDRPWSWEGLSEADRLGMTRVTYGSAKRAFQHLWERLHGAEAWSANPWVVAVGFTVERRNIDALPAPEAGRAAA